jgi:hypothetical protein
VKFERSEDVSSVFDFSKVGRRSEEVFCIIFLFLLALS